MSKTVKLSTTHRADLDEVHVTVHQEDDFVCEIAICNHSVYMGQNVDLSLIMPVVNNAHFFALMLQALLDATTDKTEIPMHVGSIDLTF